MPIHTDANAVLASFTILLAGFTFLFFLFREDIKRFRTRVAQPPTLPELPSDLAFAPTAEPDLAARPRNTTNGRLIWWAKENWQAILTKQWIVAAGIHPLSRRFQLEICHLKTNKLVFSYAGFTHSTAGRALLDARVISADEIAITTASRDKKEHYSISLTRKTVTQIYPQAPPAPPSSINTFTIDGVAHIIRSDHTHLIVEANSTQTLYLLPTDVSGNSLFIHSVAEYLLLCSTISGDLLLFDFRTHQFTHHKGVLASQSEEASIGSYATLKKEARKFYIEGTTALIYTLVGYNGWHTTRIESLVFPEKLSALPLLAGEVEPGPSVLTRRMATSGPEPQPAPTTARAATWHYSRAFKSAKSSKIATGLKTPNV